MTSNPASSQTNKDSNNGDSGSHEIKRSLRRASIAVFAGRYSDILVQIPISAVLARLLSPDEFGTVAIVFVLMVFFRMLSDIGFAVGIVQDDRLSAGEVTGLFQVSLALSVILSVALLLLAPVIASFYKSPRLIAVGRAMTLAVVFFSANVVPSSILRKSGRFRYLAICGLIASVVSGAFGIALALGDFGYMSLVWRHVLAAALNFVLCLLGSKISLRTKPRLTAIPRIFRYSVYQLLFNFINYFSRNLDKLVVGKVFGSSMLGYYEKSYRLMMYPLEALSQVFGRVIHPVLAPSQRNPELLSQVFVRLIHLLSLVAFPVSAFCYFAAEEIVLILFGDQWLSSVIYFRVLSISVGVQIIQSSMGGLYQAAGRTDWLFFTGLLSLVLIAVAISVGVVSGSLLALSIAVSAAFFANFVQGMTILARAVLGASLRHILSVLWRPTMIGGVVGVLLLTLDRILPESTGTFVAFISKFAVSAICWAVMLFASREWRVVKSAVAR